MSRIKPLKVTSKVVTLSRADFDALVEAAEDRTDRIAFAAFDADVARRGLDAVLDEALPIDAVERIADGESPLRVWREHRGLTASALAAASGVAVSYISEIETGKKPGSAATLAKLAKALRTSVDVLIA
ncbi:helix-turn-helix domain-containing protein [Roseomonas hellenica]|uniref:Helix-turn-helix domain-containing protein n=1 Tax=Plastoroseomonas hellenica TaxID=2687306 RepID=A0ABS5ESJ3_9PROT|nr:helix-turn-helix domain-containing protein [Plastoroseomonas hellenica]MBR0663264.1 helix-turn-helix domain-containing protein [Plastoroseomonas hellenica]